MTPGDLLQIPGGEFLMGQADGRDDERPLHRVTLARFRLCRYQVTNSDYDHFRRATSREKSEYRDRPEFCDPAQPVVAVNWFDAVAFCHWQGEQWNLHLRLPTEAEWEFAAYGGTGRRLYPWGDDLPSIAAGRWSHGPEPIGQDPPNGYGLFDLCQNVHEWCSDWYDPAYYAVSAGGKSARAGARAASGLARRCVAASHQGVALRGQKQYPARVPIRGLWLSYRR